MTPEHEAEARALLAQIAKTQPWAKDHDCNLKVAFAEAVLWLAEHGAILRKVPVLIRPWWIDSTVSTGWCDDPYIAVFKAVLALLKEQA